MRLAVTALICALLGAGCQLTPATGFYLVNPLALLGWLLLSIALLLAACSLGVLDLRPPDERWPIAGVSLLAVLVAAAPFRGSGAWLVTSNSALERTPTAGDAGSAGDAPRPQ